MTDKITLTAAELAEKGLFHHFNPDEARNAHGEWSSGGNPDINSASRSISTVSDPRSKKPLPRVGSTWGLHTEFGGDIIPPEKLQDQIEARRQQMAKDPAIRGELVYIRDEKGKKIAGTFEKVTPEGKWLIRTRQGDFELNPGEVQIWAANPHPGYGQNPNRVFARNKMTAGELAELQKIGPHGFTHGWVFHGVPGSQEHATSLRQLATESIRHGSSYDAVTDKLVSASDSLLDGHYHDSREALKSALDGISNERDSSGASDKSYLDSMDHALKDHISKVDSLIASKPDEKYTHDLEAGLGMTSSMPSDAELEAQMGMNDEKPLSELSDDELEAELAHRHSVGKSEETAELSTTHRPLGTHGLWGRKTDQLPAYIQNIAHAMIRDGHDESSAIALAVASVKRWARGGGHVTPEVQAAAGKALAEWEKLRAEHAGKSSGIDIGFDVYNNDSSSDVTSGELTEKAGKEGYIHGWICVAPPCGPGDDIVHPVHGSGIITSDKDGTKTAEFEDGTHGVLGTESASQSAAESSASKPAIKTIAEANKQSEAFTQFEVKRLESQINGMQAEMHTEQHKDAKAEMAMDLGAILSAAILTFLTGPIGLAALLPLLIDKGPDIANAVGKYVRIRAQHTENPLTPLKPGEKSESDDASQLVVAMVQEFVKEGIADDDADKLAAAMVQQAQDGLDAGKVPGEDDFIPSGSFTSLLSSLATAEKMNRVSVSAAQLADMIKVGPHGYIHGWHFVGIPITGSEVDHPNMGHGKVIGHSKSTAFVHFDSGEEKAFPRSQASHQASEKPRLEQIGQEHASLASLAAINNQSHAYTDAQIKQINDKFNQLRSDMHQDESHAAKIDAITDLVGLAIAVALTFATGGLSLLVAGPFIIAQAATLGPIVAKWAAARSGHSENPLRALITLKPGEKAQKDAVSGIVQILVNELVKQGLDPQIAQQFVSATAAKAQSALNAGKFPGSGNFLSASDKQDILNSVT